MTIELSQIYRIRTAEEISNALEQLCQVAWGQRTSRFVFCTPATEYDADVVLRDAISELLAARETIARMEQRT